MFVSNVGDSRNKGFDAEESILVSAMRSKFEDQILHFFFNHASHEFLELIGFRSSDVEAGLDFLIANICCNGGDEGYFFTTGSEDVVEQSCGRGFAISTGNGNDLQLARRKAVLEGSRKAFKQSSLEPVVGFLNVVEKIC